MKIEILDTDSREDKIAKMMFGVHAKTIRRLATGWLAFLGAGLIFAATMAILGY